MLNELLYKALEASFGSVLVENEGTPADITLDRSSGYETAWYIKDGDDHGEQYRVNCPICRGRDGGKDRKHHLYISYLSYARPVVNGRELAVGKLLAHCFRRDCMSEFANRRLVAQMIMAGMACVGDGMQTSTAILLERSQETEQEVKTSSSISLEGIRTWVPGFNWCSTGMDPCIAEYLTSRGITQDMAYQFGIGWGQVVTPRTGRLLNNGVPWVIVPVIMNRELRGIQARCPDQFLAEGDSMKYWMHPGMRKKTVVYNLDSARDLGVGVLCEGVFDVFKVGAPGICCFGHTPSTLQLQLIAGLDQGVVLLPDTDPHADFDTVEEAYGLAMRWNTDGVFPKGAHVVKLPAKDAGEMDRRSVWAAIMDQVGSEMREYLENKVMDKL